MKSRILELDALRGIASIMVVFFHFSWSHPVAFTKLGFKYGNTGFDLFFIISGFVIFLTLEHTKNWKDFVVSRFSRLYPTYWTCVTFTFLLLLVYYLHEGTFTKDLLKQYAGNMTMFQHYLNIQNLDQPYWTMIIEMNFYMLMLIFFLFSTIDKIEMIGVWIVLSGIVNILLLGKYGWIPDFTMHFFPLINFFPLFFAGILCYKLKFEKKTLTRYLLLLYCFIAALFIFNATRSSSLFLNTMEYAVVLAIYFGLFLLFTFNSLKFIVNPVTVFLGSISYCLYLIHQKLGCDFIIPESTKYFSYTFSFCIELITCILLAYLITRFIEQPAIRYIRNWYQKHKDAK